MRRPVRAFRGRLRRAESVFRGQTEIFAAGGAKPPPTVRAALQIDLGRLVRDVAALAPVSLAALRREALAGIGLRLAEKLLAVHGPAGTVDWDRWAAALRAITILMPKTPPRNPHDRTRPFGAALFAAGVSELQLDRLLTAQGERRRELLATACRRLAARRQTRLDLWPLVQCILCDDTTVCRYETDRQIAGEYVRAAARARRTTETVADD